MPKKQMGSIMNRDKYEALRDEGMSKQKAARIANTDPKKAANNRGGDGSYEEWSKDELYKKAKDVGLAGRSGMSKKQLIGALRSGQ